MAIMILSNGKIAITAFGPLCVSMECPSHDRDFLAFAYLFQSVAISAIASGTGGLSRFFHCNATIVSDSRIAQIIERARKAAAERAPQMRFASVYAELEKSLRESDKSKRVEFYTHDEGWKNKVICGDSLQVMESLIHYENLRGKVQMVYIDPPYGIKYDANFQQRIIRPIFVGFSGLASSRIARKHTPTKFRVTPILRRRSLSSSIPRRRLRGFSRMNALASL